MHRDIKLSNIFLSNDQVVIGDFGFAKVGMEFTTTKLGSPLTMAPEVDLSDGLQGYDSKVDIWSIGLVFYNLHFGQLPWEVETQEQLRQKIQTASGQNLPFPEFPIIGSDWKHLLMSMIEKDPEKRISWEELFKYPTFNRPAKNPSQNTRLNDLSTNVTPSTYEGQPFSDLQNTIPIRPTEVDVNLLFEANKQTYQKELAPMTNIAETINNIQAPNLASLMVQNPRSSKSSNGIFRNLKLVLFLETICKRCLKFELPKNFDLSTSNPDISKSEMLFWTIGWLIGKKCFRIANFIIDKSKKQLGEDHRIIQEVKKLYEEYRDMYQTKLNLFEQKSSPESPEDRDCFDMCRKGAKANLDQINAQIKQRIQSITSIVVLLLKVFEKNERKLKLLLNQIDMALEAETVLKEEDKKDQYLNWANFAQMMYNHHEIQLSFNKFLSKYKIPTKASK